MSSCMLLFLNLFPFSFSSFKALFPMPKCPFSRSRLTLQTILPPCLCWHAQTSLASLLPLQNKVSRHACKREVCLADVRQLRIGFIFGLTKALRTTFYSAKKGEMKQLSDSDKVSVSLTHAVRQIRFSADEKHILIACDGGNLSVYSTDDIQSQVCGQTKHGISLYSFRLPPP